MTASERARGLRALTCLRLVAIDTTGLHLDGSDVLSMALDKAIDEFVR